MKKRWISALFISAALLGATPRMQAQSTAAGSYQRNLQAGIEYYQQGSYAAAKQALLRFLAKAPQSDQTEEARYLICCCSYSLQEAERTALMRQFVRRHPSSRLRYHVWGMLGSTLFFEKDYEQAAEAFAHCKWEYLNNEKEAQDFRMQQGLSLIALGRNAEAREALRTLQESSERYAGDCTYYLACIDYLEGDLRPALEAFLNLRQNPRYAYRASCRAADIYLKAKQYELALQTCPTAAPTEEEARYTPSSEALPLQSEPARIRGEALFHLERYADAVPVLEAYSRETDSPSREALYALGASYLECKAPMNAHATLKKVVSAGSNDALAQSAYLKDGHALLALGEKAEAQKAFGHAANLPHDPKVAEEAAYNATLTIHQDTGNPPAQRAGAWQKFLKAYPQSAYKEHASAYMADLYLHEFSPQEALASIRKIAAPDSHILKAKQILSLRLGIASAQDNRMPDIELLDEAVNLGIDPAATLQALYWRGEAHYRSGRMAEAEADFRKYLADAQPATEKNYPLACYNLGYITFNANRYSEAQALFERFMQLPAERKLQADALCRIGDCLYHKRQFDEALEAYDRASALDSGIMPYALYRRAYIAGIRKDYDEKIRLLEQTIHTYPRHEIIPQALYEKGRACVLTERREEAIEAYRRLMQQYPSTEEARKAAAETGMLFAQTGRKQEAAAAYRHVVEAYPDTPEAMQSMQDLQELATESRTIGQYLQYADTLQGGRYALPEEQKESLLAQEQEIIRQEAEALRMQQTDSAYAHKDRSALLRLAADTTEESGAKAHFLLCRLTADEGRYEEAESLLLEFIDKDGNQPYWLARHFILLAEICRLQGRKAEATQYLTGLKEGYSAEDDISDLIEAEMKKLE